MNACWWLGTYTVHLLVQVLGQDVQHGSGQGLALLGQALLDIVDIDVEGPNDDTAGQRVVQDLFFLKVGEHHLPYFRGCRAMRLVVSVDGGHTRGAESVSGWPGVTPTPRRPQMYART